MTPAATRAAAHNIHDPATPITTLISAMLTAAARCGDLDTNCRDCPIQAAAADLTEYINAATLTGATR